MGNSADSQVDEEGYSFQWQVLYMKASGTFSAKNGTWKGKGLDLQAEPRKTMLGKQQRTLYMTKSIPFANPVQNE